MRIGDVIGGAPVGDDGLPPLDTYVGPVNDPAAFARYVVREMTAPAVRTALADGAARYDRWLQVLDPHLRLLAEESQ